MYVDIVHSLLELSLRSAVDRLKYRGHDHMLERGLDSPQRISLCVQFW